MARATHGPSPRWLAIAAVSLTAACGRIGFDPTADAATDAARDASLRDGEAEWDGAPDDAAGPDAAGCPVQPFETDCSDGVDEDHDGDIDCGDSDCATSVSCVGAIAVGDTSGVNAAGVGGGMPHTLSMGAGSGRLVVVAANLQAAMMHTFTSVTYDGISMTRLAPPGATLYGVGAGGTDCHGELWYILDADLPPIAGEYGVEFSQSSANAMAVWALALYGVSQTGPFGTPATLNNDPISTDVASAAGELVLDSVCVGNTALPSVGPGQTELATATAGAGLHGFGSSEPGAPMTTMSWGVGTTGGITQIALPIRPALLVPVGEWDCDDGVDDDADGETDCADITCAGSAACTVCP